MRLLEDEVADDVQVELMKDVSTIISSRIAESQRQGSTEAFGVCDLGEIVQKYKLWTKFLPYIKPFYDLKCCSDKAVITVLSQLAAGFCCNSKSEVKTLLDFGISTTRVIYTSPCKLASHVKFIANHGVNLVTFDSQSELQKIKSNHPNARLLLKICHPHGAADSNFGCNWKNIPNLLSLANDLDMNVVGLSFHPADECASAEELMDAIISAWLAFDVAQKNGFHLNILDIGGCLSRLQLDSLSETCSVLDSALSVYFPSTGNVDIIAITGNIFVEAAFTLVARIIDKHILPCGDDDKDSAANRSFAYYLSDGVYGSFGPVLCDQLTIKPKLLDPFKYAKKPLYSSSLHGPTYDSVDCIASDSWLPELEAGDWLMFANTGSYTKTPVLGNDACRPHCFYIIQDINWIRLCMSCPFDGDDGPHLTISAFNRDSAREDESAVWPEMI